MTDESKLCKCGHPVEEHEVQDGIVSCPKCACWYGLEE